MPTKKKTYLHVNFPASVILDAYRCCKAKVATKPTEEWRGVMSIGDDQEEISFDDESEYLAANPFSKSYFTFNRRNAESEFTVIRHYGLSGATVTVKLGNLEEIDEVISIFDRAYPQYKFTLEQALRQTAKVFVGHGRSPLWRDLKDHLHEKHGLEVIAYETGARGGYTIQEVLDEMKKDASIAFLIHTGEDAALDGTWHTRENVIHETGLFQGVLGFKRAIVLLEDGCNEFSNIVGLNQIRFAAGNIKETFGEVLAVIRRELGKSLFE